MAAPDLTINPYKVLGLTPRSIELVLEADPVHPYSVMTNDVHLFKDGKPITVYDLKLGECINMQPYYSSHTGYKPIRKLFSATSGLKM